MTNSTALALTVVDAQIDYNMKLISFIVVVSYAVIFYYVCKKSDLSSWTDIIKVFMSKLLFYPTIIFLPLYILLLDREFSFITMWTWLIIGYGAVWFILFCLILIWGAEFIFRMVGLDMSYSAWKDNRLEKKETEGLL